MPTYIVKFQEEVYDAEDEFEQTNELEDTVVAENEKIGRELAIKKQEEWREKSGFNATGSFFYNVVDVRELNQEVVPEIYDESGYQVG